MATMCLRTSSSCVSQLSSRTANCEGPSCSYARHTTTVSSSRSTYGRHLSARTDASFQAPSRRCTSLVPRAYDTVADIMTANTLVSVTADTTVDDALELLVRHRITGLPVVDDKHKVVGVVSDFDLLALDSLGRTNDGDLFPVADQTWQAFKELRSMMAKSAGKKVKDVMTPRPICVNPETNLNDATRMLLTKKIRRLPVVDDNGTLVGVVSRGNIVKAALAARREAAAAKN